MLMWWIINLPQEQAGLEAQQKKMSRTIIINLLRFIVLVFIQVFLLKNITLYNLSTPYLYILFILLLPFETPNIVIVYTWHLLLGITIDAFYDTPGLHAAACVLLAFVRYYLSA